MSKTQTFVVVRKSGLFRMCVTIVWQRELGNSFCVELEKAPARDRSYFREYDEFRDRRKRDRNKNVRNV